jgi:hypothetical protein
VNTMKPSLLLLLLLVVVVVACCRTASAAAVVAVACWPPSSPADGAASCVLAAGTTSLLLALQTVVASTAAGLVRRAAAAVVVVALLRCRQQTATARVRRPLPLRRAVQPISCWLRVGLASIIICCVLVAAHTASIKSGRRAQRSLCRRCVGEQCGEVIVVFPKVHS